MQTAASPARSRKSLFSLLLVAASLGLQAAPLPTGGSVTAGQATIAATDAGMTITQSTPRAIIQWGSFDIAAGQTVRFVQPTSAAVALNRVIGADPSVLQGNLSANGRVFLLNPNGILFAPSARVDVGGLVASTLALADADFLAGNYVLSGTSQAGIHNQGNIVAVADGQGGVVAMIAAQVINEGNLTAPRGAVLLGAGRKVTLDVGGPVALTIEEAAVDALVRNGGAIKAPGGKILLTAQAAGDLASLSISNEGVLEAQTLATGEKGEILLLAGMTKDSLHVGGTLDASAPQGGDGGFIETSAAHLTFAPDVVITTGAPAGRAGRWLLDPATLEIVTGSYGSTTGMPATGITQLGMSVLETALVNGNVDLQATSAIDFQSTFNYGGGSDTTLSLFAPTILLGGNITTSTHKLGLNFGGLFNSTNYAGNLSVYGADRSISTRGGAVVFNGNLGGGYSLSVATAGGNITSNATVNGTFSTLVPVTGTLTIEYQAGGPTQVPAIIDFQTQTITINGGPPNQFGASNVFPSGTVTFQAGTVFDLNASDSFNPIFTRPNTSTFNLTPDASNGRVTFAATENVVKIEFRTKSSNWVTLTASNVTWKASANAAALNNLTLDAGSGTITLNAPIAVSGDLKLNTGLFVNNVGSAALVPGAGKTWQVWSSNPAPHDPTTGDVDGNLAYDFKQYGATFGSTPLAGSGNGLFYTYTPLATIGLTGTITKVYDGTDAASNLLNANYTASGGVDGDTVAKALAMPTAGAYADKNVGVAKTVTVSGLNSAHFSVTSSTGKPVYGYGLTSASAVGAIGTITPKDITAVTGLTAQDKVYDGNTSATLNLGSASFTGLIQGDNLTVASATGVFADKNVGAGKTVNVSGITLGGTDLGNYTLVSANSTTTAAITKLRLTSLTGIAAEDKTYDRTTGATLDVSGASFNGLVTGDDLSITAGTGTFADWNVGTAKTVTVAGLTFGGADAGNYDLPLAPVTTTGNITPKDITAVTNIGALDKVYDGNTSATLDTSAANFTGLIQGDNLSVSAATGVFADKNVGTGKTVNISGITLGGTDLGNYTLVSANSTTTAAITKLRLTSLTGIAAEDKTYDRTTGATLDVSGASFNGLVTGDDLSITAGTGTFADWNVGTAKTVTVAGLTFGGADAGNYDLPLAPVTTTGNITPKAITAVTNIGALDKVYDGNTSATLDTSAANFTGLIQGDNLSVSAATGVFADKNVGTGKTVNVSGITLGGTDLGNYTLVSANSTTTAAITKLRLTSLTGIAAEDKTYDRTTGATLDVSGASFNGLVTGDDLSITAGTGTFADWNVGTAKTVTVAGLTFGGADAGNYDLPLAPVTTTGNITPKDITAVTNIGALDKVYDGNTSATLDLTSAAFTGLIQGDNLSVTSANGAFADKNVGTGKTVNVSGITLGGTDLGNYTLVSANSTTTAAITRRTLTGITGITANGKVYDGGISATVNLGGAVFGGLVGGDNLTLTGGAGQFANANAGNGKSVTISGHALGGTDAGNYALPASLTALADITPAPLSVRATDLSKTYDGTPFAGGNGVTFVGFVPNQGPGDLIGSLTFSGNSQGAVNAGTYVLTPGGYASNNYALNFVDGVLTIAGAAPAVDVRVFLPQTVVVPVLAVPVVTVSLPLAPPGGLNYVATSLPTPGIVAFAPTVSPVLPTIATPTTGPSATAPLAPVVAPTASPATTSPAAPSAPTTPVATATQPAKEGSAKPAAPAAQGEPIAASPAAEPASNEAAPAGPNSSRRAQDGVTRSLLGPLDVIVVNGGVNLGARPVVAE